MCQANFHRSRKRVRFDRTGGIASLGCRRARGPFRGAGWFRARRNLRSPLSVEVCSGRASHRRSASQAVKRSACMMFVHLAMYGFAQQSNTALRANIQSKAFCRKVFSFFRQRFAVWARESRPPPNEQSPTILHHEADRAKRMVDLWEHEIDHPMFRGELNLAQITLACALGFAALIPELHWRPGHPKLCNWFDHIAARPSIAATAPPGHH